MEENVKTVKELMDEYQKSRAPEKSIEESIEGHLRKISGWVEFFGYLTVISLIASLIYVMSIVNALPGIF